MSGLWTVTSMLVFLLSGGSADVNQNQLAELITDLKNQYQVPGIYSLALSIQSEDPKNLDQIFKDNYWYTVEQTAEQGCVFKSDRLAVAAVGPYRHAEYRVLRDLELQSNKGDLLVLFSYASPCDQVCADPKHPDNILTFIKKAINSKKWSKHVFVFEEIFKPRNSKGIPKDKLETALRNLGNSGIGLANIFRCFKPVNRAFQCTSCSSGGKVTKDCVDYNSK